jgi:hypothetical protein
MAQKNNNSRSSVIPTQSTILEQVDIFFYTLKVKTDMIFGLIRKRLWGSNNIGGLRLYWLSQPKRSN